MISTVVEAAAVPCGRCLNIKTKLLLGIVTQILCSAIVVVLLEDLLAAKSVGLVSLQFYNVLFP